VNHMGGLVFLKEGFGGGWIPVMNQLLI